MSASEAKASSPLCQVESLNFVTKGRVILENISFSIAPGEKVSVVGPNGGGKTLLIRLLIGAAPPTTGTITIKPGTIIGYQPQQNYIDPSIPLSARALLEMTCSSSADGIDGICKLLELSERTLDSQLTRLSGGERQMIMVARAMLRNPKLLVLDEPGTYCDDKKLAMLYGAIEQFSDDTGCAILCVSHDISLVLAHSDHTMCIDRRLVCEGGPQDIISDPKFQQLSYSENVGLYKHHHDH